MTEVGAHGWEGFDMRLCTAGRGHITRPCPDGCCARRQARGRELGRRNTWSGGGGAHDAEQEPGEEART
jgi:hypothetical protein